MRELVSIIIPAYNAEKCIGRCLKSVLGQTYTEYEIIIVDDGSTDRTGLILKEYVERYQNIYVYNTNHQGVSAARNKGLEMARGNFIAFVDADDEILPCYLERLFDILQKSRAQVAVCGIKHINSNDSYVNQERVCSNIKEKITVQTGRAFLLKMEEPLRYEKTAVCWNKLYKKEVFKNVQYPKGRIYEDCALMQDILYPVDTLVETEEVLYIYHTETMGITRSTYSKEHLDEVIFAKRRMRFFGKRKEKGLYILARKQYCIALLKHYYLLKKSNIATPQKIIKLRKEQKRYLKGFEWKRCLPFMVRLVFEMGRYLPFLSGWLIVFWDCFLERRFREKA